MSLIERFKRFTAESLRVIRVTRKPTKDEYWTIVKVSAIGILLIGFLGFLLRMIEDYFSIYIAAIVVVVIILFLMYYKR